MVVDDSAAVMSVDVNVQNIRVIGNERSNGTQNINWINRTITERWDTFERVEKVLPWLILLWLIGVVVCAIKLGGGLFCTANLRKLPAKISNPKLDNLVNELTSRLSIKRTIKLCESSLMNVPITSG